MIALPELPPPATEEEKIRISIRLKEPSAHQTRAVPLQFKYVPPRPLNLSEAFLDAHRMSTHRRGSTVAYSIVFHALAMAVVLLIPFWFTNTLDLQSYTRTLLIAPPPPPPAPVAPAAPVARAAANPVEQHRIIRGQLLVPTYIPKQIAIVKEPQVAPEPSGGVLGGVLGGVPGGVLGGVLSAGLGEVAPPPPSPPAAAVPAAKEAPREPLRVGGAVKPPQILRQVAPVYPKLAQIAKLEGKVVIAAVIDAKGNVVQMKVVSGHPLLMQAAMDALRQWKFAPTMLDGEPVPISWDVTITFQMD